MSSKKKTKSEFTINLEYFLFSLIAKIYRVLSLKKAYLLAKIIGRIAYWIDFIHRRRIIRNLLHAGIAKNKTEAIELAKKNFTHFAMLFVEIIKFRQIVSPENFHKHITVSGNEQAILAGIGDKTKGIPPQQVIIITGHFGNWEIAGSAFTFLSGKEMLSVMRPFDNPKIGAEIEDMRIGHKHTVVHKKGAIRALVEAVKNKHNICFVSDQHASTSEGVETIFFGHPARSHTAPSGLHLKTGLPIIVGGLVRKNENFEFEFVADSIIQVKPSKDRDADIRSITQAYTSSLQNIISKYPEQWLWAHRRWLDLER
ncbi:MAG: lysophospholipid acyltransferase family protein [Candidatus Nanoarchaeia archaeon]